MDGCTANAKKSLFNSLETLNFRANQLSDLSEFSNRLVRKFTNPMPEPECVEKLNETKGSVHSDQPDLIDLFNITAERMQKEIDIIGNNIDRVIQMIE